MATKVVMEALSPTMEEGRLVEWKKAEGDTVATGDVLAEVETDKAVMELVARADGTLLKHIVAAGSTVPVASPVAVIGEPGEDVSEFGGGDGKETGKREEGVEEKEEGKREEGKG
ncbi:MAG: biotin/lipoyl-containing protein, partial [Gemmatimonadales bacterium]